MILGSGVACSLDLLCVVLFSRSICVFSLSISFIHKYISFFSLLRDHGVSDTSARKCSFALRRLIGYFTAKWKRMKKKSIYTHYTYRNSSKVQLKAQTHAQQYNPRHMPFTFFYFKSTVYLMVYFFSVLFILDF